jgi:hypothetical protein
MAFSIRRGRCYVKDRFSLLTPYDHASLYLCIYWLLTIQQMTNNVYYTIGTVPKSNSKNRRKRQYLTHIQGRSLSWLATDSSVKECKTSFMGQKFPCY